MSAEPAADALSLDLASAEASIPAEEPPPAPPGAAPGAAPAGAKPVDGELVNGPSEAISREAMIELVTGIAGMAADSLFSRWNFTAQERQQWSALAARAMELWFPITMPPKWAALVNLGACTVVMVGARVGPKGLPKIGPPDRPNADGAQPAS